MYTLICTADYNSVLSSDSLAGNTNIITLEPFTIPWNWGKDFDLSGVITYSITDNLGTIGVINNP